MNELVWMISKTDAVKSSLREWNNSIVQSLIIFLNKTKPCEIGKLDY